MDVDRPANPEYTYAYSKGNKHYVRKYKIRTSVTSATYSSKYEDEEELVKDALICLGAFNPALVIENLVQKENNFVYKEIKRIPLRPVL